MTPLPPHSANVPGDFYVQTDCCTMCEVPFSEAPELFGKAGQEHDYQCFVKRQPQTPNDLEKMLNAMRFAELDCIRYRGSARRIQLRLISVDCGNLCDQLPPDLQQQVNEMNEEEAKRKQARHSWKLW